MAKMNFNKSSRNGFTGRIDLATFWIRFAEEKEPREVYGHEDFQNRGEMGTTREGKETFELEQANKSFRVDDCRTETSC